MEMEAPFDGLLPLVDIYWHPHLIGEGKSSLKIERLVSREVSYFRESRMSPWKNRAGWSRTQKPVLRPFSFFTIRPFLQFYSRWDLGIMKQKLMNYPTETEHEAMGQRQRTEDHGKVILCECFFFAVIHPTLKHAPWKQSTIKRSVDQLELFDDQRRKSARTIWFLSSPWSGFRQLSTACDDLSSN